MLAILEYSALLFLKSKEVKKVEDKKRNIKCHDVGKTRMLDNVALIAFPFLSVIANIIFWATYF